MLANEMNRICKKHKILRIFLTALSGSLLELLLLIGLKNYVLYLVVSHFAVLPLMVFAAFGRCGGRLFLKNSAVCYGAAVLLGGCTEAAENTWGIHQTPLLAGLLGVLGCISLFHFVRRERRLGGQLYPVELGHNGRTVLCTGLFDTGNLLREPAAERPVSIVSPDILKKLAPQEEDRCGVVLYRTLGKSDGALEIYRIGRLSVKRNGEWQHTAPAVIAAAPAGLLRGKRYGVILNGAL